MPVSIIKTDIFQTGAEAIVNPVNTVGVMGAGLALEFKNRFPLNFKLYKEACRNGSMKTGRIFMTRNHGSENPKWIVNFPTKDHFRNPSRMEWIEDGLDDLAQAINERKIRSIAMPALGCGLGGLKWKDVRPKIMQALDGIERLEAILCDPR